MSRAFWRTTRTPPATSDTVYKLPRAVQFVDDVPITASGKIMRRLLANFDDGTR